LGVAERLSVLPRKQRPPAGWDFSFLSDGEPWLLVRGVDFEPDVTLASARRRIREWARREGYGLERGYVLETRTVARHPTRGQDYRELKAVPKRDRATRPEYGLAVRLVKDPERARRRLRQYRSE
jgi:hypothetical protein